MSALNHTTDIFKALSDQHRVRALFALRDGELCVCQLIELLNLAPSTVSKHLSILRDAELIQSRKDGRWVYYSLSEDAGFPMIGKITPLVFQALEKSPEIRADTQHLKKIQKMTI